VLRKLGKGSFATVYLARMLDTHQVVAMKVISKEAVREGGLHEQVMKERTALTMASRYATELLLRLSAALPNLPMYRYPDYFVKLLYCFQNQDSLFFVMEYMQVCSLP
jgi:serine/threonine protein kinase